MVDVKILEKLVCPCCKGRVSESVDGRSLVCSAPRRHCFDFAASGYVNLAPSHSGGGDSKSAVRSRTAFLDSGAYERVSDALNDIISEEIAGGGFVVDAGCGEGYYSCRLSERGFLVAGFDLSKDAVAHASKRAKRESLKNTFFGVGSVFELPVADGAADAVINIFAPCVEAEYKRVLKPGGILAVAYAGKDHLMGLKKFIYENVYENEIRTDLPEKMALLYERRVKFDLSLESNEQIMNLFSMTPYYWRTSVADKQKLEGVGGLDTEVDVIIAIYKNECEETL